MNVYDFDNTIYDGESTLDLFFFYISRSFHCYSAGLISTASTAATGSFPECHKAGHPLCADARRF